MIQLSPFLVPYYTNRKMDEIAEDIWRNYDLTEALTDPKARNAVRLAEQMGLSILYLPVYEHKEVDSIVFFQDSTLLVGADRIERDEAGNRVIVKDDHGETRVIPANTIVINTNRIPKEYAAFAIFHECIHYFGSKVWHSTSKYRRVIWQCNHKFRNGEKCRTPHLYEDEIKQKFIKVCGMVGDDKDDFLASCREITEALCDSAALDKQIENLLVRADELTAVMQGFIRENAEHEQNQDLYNQKYAEYEKQMNTVEEEIQRLRKKKADQIARKELLDGMIREIEENDLTVTAFDEKLWRLMVESVEVCENGKLVFTLRNGMEIEV